MVIAGVQFPRFGNIELLKGPALDRAYDGEYQKPWRPLRVLGDLARHACGVASRTEQAVDAVVIRYARENQRPDPHTIYKTEPKERLLVTGEADNQFVNRSLSEAYRTAITRYRNALTYDKPDETSFAEEVAWARQEALINILASATQVIVEPSSAEVLPSSAA